MEPRAPSTNDLAPGAVIAGKFRLDRLIGRGGMGSVWAARHTQLGMLVAIKFIDAEAEGVNAVEARARFEREARAAGQLRSPHVVQIIDHGTDGDRPYIVMELLEGEDLGERLRREGRLSLPATSRILGQTAKALRRAHEAGVIHRDLKPGNVFLARFDDDEVVKILDFGVAKLKYPDARDSADVATQAGIVFGSPSYMSPEQARGVRDLDHRTDLWSLAVILFRAVTGVKPFHASSIGDLVIKLCIDPLPVPTSVAPDLPREIDAFFDRAFCRDIERRFPTATEMAAAFEAIVSGARALPAPFEAAAASGPAPRADPPSGPTPSRIEPPSSRAHPFAIPSGGGTVIPAPVPAAPTPARPAPRPLPRAPAPSNVLPEAPHLSGARPPSASIAGPQAALYTAAVGPQPAPYSAALGPQAAPHGVPLPAPMLPAPAALPSVMIAPQAPASAPGSGPHVAFAPGTLTPPAGAPAGPPAAAPQGYAFAAPQQPPPAVRPFPEAAPGPHFITPPYAPVPPVPPVAPVLPVPAPQGPRAPQGFAWPAQGKLIVGAGIGATALGLLIVIIALSAGRGPEVAAPADPTARVTAPPPPPAPSRPPPPAEAPSVAEPPPSALPSASADPSAAAPTESAAAPETDPSAKAAPRLPRGRKKKPNFGY